MRTVELNRLHWASRRGMLELDLILMPVFERGYPALSELDKASYARLLESEDQDLFAWFLHRQEPEDASLQVIVERIRSFTRERPGS